MSSIDLQLIMDSKQKCLKKVKLCEDLDYYEISFLKEPQKERLLQKIVDIFEELKEINESFDPKEEMDYKNNGIELTQLTIDENSLEIRELLFRRLSTHCEPYYPVIKELNDKHIELEVESKRLAKELLFWQNKIKSVDKEVNKRIKVSKRWQWCRVCRRRAAIPYRCCRVGYYCSFAHLKGDRNHYKYCKRNENRPNPYL